MAAPPLGLARRVAGVFTSPAVAHSGSRPRGLRPGLLPSKRWSGVVRMGSVVGGGQEGAEDEELRQTKEQAAARRRWETLIREQKIKTLTPREAGYAFKLTDKALLDVRPSNERQKAWVKGSTWIPIFDVDTSVDLSGLSKKVSNFVMGGWWSGSSTLSFNKNFVQQVEEKFSKDTDVILVCQKGLRSLAACEQLYNAGFENLFWVQGGLEAAEEEDFEREGSQPFKLAAIGGVSEFFGSVPWPELWQLNSFPKLSEIMPNTMFARSIAVTPSVSISSIQVDRPTTQAWSSLAAWSEHWCYLMRCS